MDGCQRVTMVGKVARGRVEIASGGEWRGIAGKVARTGSCGNGGDWLATGGRGGNGGNWRWLVLTGVDGWGCSTAIVLRKVMGIDCDRTASKRRVSTSVIKRGWGDTGWLLWGNGGEGRGYQARGMVEAMAGRQTGKVSYMVEATNGGDRSRRLLCTLSVALGKTSHFPSRLA